LALFGRRPIERVAAIVFTGIQKPAQQRTLALQNVEKESSLVIWLG
jgi:hypothetical protein